jgi:hypothetical protein
VTQRLARRLREHRRELKGRGARATSGQWDWRLLFVVAGLPDRRTALQLEWRLHRRYRAPAAGSNPFGANASARRAWQLYTALLLPYFTARATPVAHLPPLRIGWHSRTLLRGAQGLPWPAQVTHGFAASASCSC